MVLLLRCTSFLSEATQSKKRHSARNLVCADVCKHPPDDQGLQDDVCKHPPDGQGLQDGAAAQVRQLSVRQRRARKGTVQGIWCVQKHASIPLMIRACKVVVLSAAACPAR
eukprot:1156838-Pelagomonas_calceolata.AAC.4